jgi:hypothetical protein
MTQNRKPSNESGNKAFKAVKRGYFAFSLLLTFFIIWLFLLGAISLMFPVLPRFVVLIIGTTLLLGLVYVFKRKNRQR